MEKSVYAYGITYDEFWYREMDIVKLKYDAFVQNMKYQIMLMDTEAWAVGKYVRQAIVSVFNKQARYPQQPDSRVEAAKPKTEEERNIQLFNQLERWRKSYKKKTTKPV